MPQPPPSKRSKLHHDSRASHHSLQPIQKLPSSTPINPLDDPRFAHLLNGQDPRYRPVSKKRNKVKLDSRFAHLLHDERFSSKAKVDRYGRKLPKTNARNELEKFYRLEEENEEPISGSDGPTKGSKKREGLGPTQSASEKDSPQSSSGDESSSEDSVSSDDEQEVFGSSQHQEQVESIPEGEVTRRLAVMNLDWDHIRAADIMAVLKSFVPTGNGRIDSVTIYPSELGRERMQREELEGPPKELFAHRKAQSDVASSLKAAQNENSDETDNGGEGVSDMEDGSERSYDEEEIKKSMLKDDQGVEYNSAKLRRYQLERLRYFYAVVTCSSSSIAGGIYDAVDGTEYLSTANFFDLRFIPDGTDFLDDRPRDSCDDIPRGYKPTEFVTDALQHSKVRLTWDADDNERKEAQKRAFKGGRKAIDENDLTAYLASDSSDADDLAPEPIVIDATDDVPGPNSGDTETVDPNLQPGLTKREAERKRVRALLGLPTEPSSETKDEPEETDMQVTWGAFGDAETGVDGTPETIQETAVDKYIRKERERKAKRKEKAASKRNGVGNMADQSTTQVGTATDIQEAEPQEEDAGFNDPFFTSTTKDNDPATTSAKPKISKKEKRRQREAEEAARRKPTNNTSHEDYLQDDYSHEANHDDDDDLNHFDMNALTRAEKLTQKKRKQKHLTQRDRAALDARGQDTFQIDVQDARFKDLYERPEFAVDPTHPRFSGTEGMRKLLQEKGRRDGDQQSRQQQGAGTEMDQGPDEGRDASIGDGEIGELVRKVKKKKGKKEKKVVGYFER